MTLEEISIRLHHIQKHVVTLQVASDVLAGRDAPTIQRIMNSELAPMDKEITYILRELARMRKEAQDEHTKQDSMAAGGD